jgi:hypothetical protein
MRIPDTSSQLVRSGYEWSRIVPAGLIRPAFHSRLIILCRVVRWPTLITSSLPIALISCCIPCGCSRSSSSSAKMASASRDRRMFGYVISYTTSRLLIEPRIALDEGVFVGLGRNRNSCYPVGELAAGHDDSSTASRDPADKEPRFTRRIVQMSSINLLIGLAVLACLIYRQLLNGPASRSPCRPPVCICSSTVRHRTVSPLLLQ